MLVYAGWLFTNPAKAMGWVAYNMNKRHARGLWCLKYDKKASMTNQSSGIGLLGALGKIWELGDYDDSNWTKAARSFLDRGGGGEWVVGIGRRLAGKNDERATV